MAIGSVVRPLRAPRSSEIFLRLALGMRGVWTQICETYDFLRLNAHTDVAALNSLDKHFRCFATNLVEQSVDCDGNEEDFAHQVLRKDRIAEIV